MTDVDQSDDLRAIKTLIGAHFHGLRWTSTSSADWATFSADFLMPHCFQRLGRYVGKHLMPSSRV